MSETRPEPVREPDYREPDYREPDHRDPDVVEAEVLEPDVFEGQDPTPADVRRPDVPRTPEGEPTDFAPLQVPVVEPEPATTAASPSTSELDDAAQWQELQGRFVDDPAAAVSAAADLVEDAVARLRDAYTAADTADDSTEQLRRSFRHYRDVHRAVAERHPD